MAKLLRFVSRVLSRARGTPYQPVPVDPLADGADSDQAVLHQLRAHGADLNKPTHVLFYVYVPTEEAARRVAERGADAVLVAEVQPSAAGDGTWLCLLQGTLVPAADVLGQYRDRFESLAAAEGGEYDGWEAAVTK